MRLKLYRAAGMAEAMARVRADLGADALILASRRVGGEVEITAALEPEAPPPIPADPARRAALAFHAVPEALRDRLMRGGLAEALAEVIGFGGLDLGAGARPLLLVGPPGAGKTLSVARLATRLVMGGHQPLVVTADGQRAGATEQLAAFTRLLGVNLIVASNPLTLARALAQRMAGAPVLIDAPGIDPFDPPQREEIAALAATADAAMVLVLPAGLDANEAAETAAAFAGIGARLLVATRLDMARRLGGVLSAAAGGKLVLVEAGIGPGAADGLVPMTPALLAARLIETKPPAPEPPR
jgi:flagellar biosynthesis protein FlhF